MHKIGDDTPATADGNKEFRPGVPGTSELATIVKYEFMNTLQRELVKVIEAAGITLDQADDEQLFKALQAMAENGALINASGVQSVPTGVFTEMDLDNVIYDTGSYYNSSNGFTIPAGVTKVQLFSSVHFDPIADSTYRLITTWKNGAAFIGNGGNTLLNAGSAAATGMIAVSVPVDVVQGDVLTAVCGHGRGSNLSTNSFANHCYLGMRVIK